MSELRSAAGSGDTNYFLNFVDAGGNLEERVPMLGSPGYETFLHIAAEEGQRGLVQTLLSLGANANSTNFLGKTPLMHVIDSGDDESHQAIARTLLEYGADVSAKDHFSNGVLKRACSHGEPYLRMLLEAGADPNSRDASQSTPLHYARTAKSVAMLAEAGAELNATNSIGQTPLDVALKNEAKTEAATELRKRGAVALERQRLNGGK